MGPQSHFVLVGKVTPESKVLEVNVFNRLRTKSVWVALQVKECGMQKQSILEDVTGPGFYLEKEKGTLAENTDI